MSFQMNQKIIKGHTLKFWSFNSLVIVAFNDCPLMIPYSFSVFTTAIQFDYPTIAGRIKELAFLYPEVESLQPVYSSVASLKLLNIDFSMSLEFLIFSF
ncbi:hypothetical protein LOK49_LG06G00889 [Camellia lanceoleosa]|uniref:Uncharacterized protein n=1 Tax=Camellia lanceoleosa TaxID=1840588 RepID=A0ACC0HCL9_9ERIC|nr:hypothetical protein LOK49_LG06G00889 [Camellia lanceoleosa]